MPETSAAAAQRALTLGARSSSLIGDLTIWLDKTSSKQQDSLNAKLAEAFFSSASPFRLVENSAFREFIMMLRPSFQMPSRKMLSGILLDNAYSSIKATMDSRIKAADYVSIVTDSWTDVNGRPIMNYIVLTPEPFFFKSIYTQEQSHTAVYIADQLSEVIEAIGVQKVSSVVTDNATANGGAWNLLMEKYKEQGLMAYGCSAHWINLSVQDIIRLPYFAAVYDFSRRQVQRHRNGIGLRIRLFIREEGTSWLRKASKNWYLFTQIWNTPPPLT